MTLTLFSWGYWGWGNATPQLVRAIDAVEAARGFQPPLFIDVRISRSVRAKGFNGNAFGDLIGPERYQHMSALGNLSIKEHLDERIHIKDPAAAEQLLDIALAAKKAHQRVIFFCSCEFPGSGDHTCHRVSVANLVLKYARRRNVALEVVEWPGGTPHIVERQLNKSEAQKLLRGGRAISLGRKLPSSNWAGLSWGSVVHGLAPDREFSVMTGPARYSRGQWFLPVLNEETDLTASVAQVVRSAQRWRKAMGLEARKTLG